jgi:DNA-directed RNA polymerase specialized sigma24 family protein
MGSFGGREQRWKELMARYTGPLVGYFRKTKAGPDDVTELLGDVWAAAVEMEPAIFGASDPWPILHAIAKPIAVEWKARARHEIPLADAMPSAAVASEAPGPDLSERERRAPMLLWQAAALATLSEKQRSVVDLRIRYGIPDDMLAEALNIPRSTLRVYAKRGLARLRQYAREYPPPPGKKLIDAIRILQLQCPLYGFCLKSLVQIRMVGWQYVPAFRGSLVLRYWTVARIDTPR